MTWQAHTNSRMFTVAASHNGTTDTITAIELRCQNHRLTAPYSP